MDLISHFESLSSEEAERLPRSEQVALPGSEKPETGNSDVLSLGTEDDQVIQNEPTSANHLEIDTNHTQSLQNLQPTQFSTPVKTVQYVDEKTKVSSRKAELEELRKRSDLKQKKAAFNSESPMSTSLASFFLQQKQMKLEVRKHRQGALSSLSNYKSRDGEGILSTKNVKRNNMTARQDFGMPSAYASAIDDFFRKQKQMDLEWKKNKESTLKRLHLFRQAHVQKDGADSKGDCQAELPHDSEPESGSSNDEEVFSSLLVVHAELLQFFTAFSASHTHDLEFTKSRSKEGSEGERSDQVPNTPTINAVTSPEKSENTEDVDSPTTTITPVCIDSERLEKEKRSERSPESFGDDPCLSESPELPSTLAEKSDDEGGAENHGALSDHVGDRQDGSSAQEFNAEKQEMPLDTAETDVSQQDEGAEPPAPDSEQIISPDPDKHCPCLAENEQDGAVDVICQEAIRDSHSQSQQIFSSNISANPAEEKKDDAFDILDELLDDSFVMEKGSELLDPFSVSEQRRSLDTSERYETPNNHNTHTKSLQDSNDEPYDALSTIDGCKLEEYQHVISSITAVPQIQTVGSLVSSIGSSIDEDTIPSGGMSRQSSSSSLSSFWDLDTDIPALEDNHYSEALMCSEEQYLPNLHSTKGPCERCLSLASEEERTMFQINGRHVRIMLVRGGCKRSCTAFPRGEEEAPVRLCRKCYFDTHRKPRTPTSERCQYI